MDLDQNFFNKKTFSLSYLYEPRPSLDEEFPAQIVDEPLVTQEVAGHVNVPVVQQDARLSRRRHQHRVEFSHGLELPIVTAAHFVAA